MTFGDASRPVDRVGDLIDNSPRPCSVDSLQHMAQAAALLGESWVSGGTERFVDGAPEPGDGFDAVEAVAPSGTSAATG